MVNIEDFIKRLEVILDYYGLNASSFADNIGVQRSSLSHLLSGRNKPSLDFILKILEVYPEVDLYWILNGKGIFPKVSVNQKISSPSSSSVHSANQEIVPPNIVSPDKAIVSETNSNIQDSTAQELVKDSEIDKIVIFYKDGTFKSYRP
ncbi:helix-turn-helix domain-containing protein [Flavobacterium frigidarium]|uniref:helix-turn-helix domain-containing protein n=1 Tax=Flavobacterium frigidarium TaxID=99286 RepID=UPI00040E2603|nr:helix-turn-helix transcriptional regulator [Flavobacterium frigidarium]